MEIIQSFWMNNMTIYDIKQIQILLIFHFFKNSQLDFDHWQQG